MEIKVFLSNLKKMFLSKSVVKQSNIKNYVRSGLDLGEGTFFTSKIKIDRPNLTKIGNNCIFADDVTILNHDASTMIHSNFGERKRVSIGDNCFIGYKSIILPGVEIGDCSIIGAGSVVTKDIPSFSVAAGNPAKVVMTLDDFVSRRKRKLKSFYLIREKLMQILLV